MVNIATRARIGTLKSTHRTQTKKAQTRKREESTTTTLIKADKNKTKPSASLLSRVYARSSSNLTWSNSIAFPSLNMHSFSSNKSFCVAFFVEQSSNW